MMNPLDSNVQTSFLQGQGQLQKLQRQYEHPTTADSKKMKQAAQEFESIFMQQMLDMMDKTVDRENSLLGGGSAEQYWRGMLNQEIAKGMCMGNGGSGLGLAETIYKQMAAQSQSPSADTTNEVK